MSHNAEALGLLALMLLRLEDQGNGFYPYHAALAGMLRRTNQHQAAADSCERALSPCGNRAERAYLQRRLDEMLKSVG